MTRIHIALNNLLRTCLNLELLDGVRVEELYKKLNLPSLNQMIVESSIKEVWKSLHSIEGQHEEPFEAKNYNRAMRSATNEEIQPVIDTSALQQSSTIWNSIPIDERQKCNTPYGIKKMAKHHSKLYPL